MKHIRQTRKNNCGQTCVAMIVNHVIDRDQLPYEHWDPERIGKHLMHTNSVTSYWEIQRTLVELGAQNLSQLVHRVTKHSGFCFGEIMLCRVRVSSTKSHWIVIDKMGIVYDPGQPEAMTFKKWQTVVGLKINSYMVVR